MRYWFAPLVRALIAVQYGMVNHVAMIGAIEIMLGVSVIPAQETNPDASSVGSRFRKNKIDSPIPKGFRLIMHFIGAIRLSLSTAISNTIAQKMYDATG